MIKDNAIDGTNHKYATVQSGGVNYRHAVIYYQSLHGRNVDFTIDIYGDASMRWILFGQTEVQNKGF